MIRKCGVWAAATVCGDLVCRLEDKEYASSCRLPTTWTACHLRRVIAYNHDTS